MYNLRVTNKTSVNFELTLAAQLKALGDTTRIDLLKAVSATAAHKACVCDLTPATGLSQGTVSHHLKILVDAGLLTRTQKGKWSYYALTQDCKKLMKSLGIPRGVARSSKNC
jgi:ArsR family transcriptional regulator